MSWPTSSVAIRSNCASPTTRRSDPISGKPYIRCASWTSACAAAQQQFGWERRSPLPRSMRDKDGTLIGWGVACGGVPGLHRARPWPRCSSMPMRPPTSGSAVTRWDRGFAPPSRWWRPASSASSPSAIRITHRRHDRATAAPDGGLVGHGHRGASRTGSRAQGARPTARASDRYARHPAAWGERGLSSRSAADASTGVMARSVGYAELFAARRPYPSRRPRAMVRARGQAGIDSAGVERRSRNPRSRVPELRRLLLHRALRRSAHRPAHPSGAGSRASSASSIAAR